MDLYCNEARMYFICHLRTPQKWIQSPSPVSLVLIRYLMIKNRVKHPDWQLRLIRDWLSTWLHSPLAPAQTLADVIDARRQLLCVLFCIFWFNFCILGGSGNMLSIFIYSRWFHSIKHSCKEIVLYTVSGGRIQSRAIIKIVNTG